MIFCFIKNIYNKIRKNAIKTRLAFLEMQGEFLGQGWIFEVFIRNLNYIFYFY